jgi:hypothetical protein
MTLAARFDSPSISALAASPLAMVRTALTALLAFKPKKSLTASLPRPAFAPVTKVG